MAFFDVYRQAYRREPEAAAGHLLADDGFFGALLLGIAIVTLADFDLASSAGLAAIGLAMIGAPVAVAIRPSLCDLVLKVAGTAIAAAGLLNIGMFIHYLIENPTGGVRYAPGGVLWILCNAALHWVATGSRHPWIRLLPRVALVIGLLCEALILYLVVPRFANLFSEIAR